MIAQKMGVDSWKDVACIQENVERYGILKSGSLFKKGTLLRIPMTTSHFQLDKLMNRGLEFEQSLGTCLSCHVPENPNDPNDPPMLLCDGCDASCHLSCRGLSEIPSHEWFCSSCLSVLKVRALFLRQHQYPGDLLARPSTTTTTTPPNLILPITILQTMETATQKLRRRLQTDRTQALKVLHQSNVLQQQEFTTNIQTLTQERYQQFLSKDTAMTARGRALYEMADRHGLEDWGGGGDSFFITTVEDGRLRRRDEILRWISSTYRAEASEYRFGGFYEPVFSSCWKSAMARYELCCKDATVVREERRLRSTKDRIEAIDKEIQETTNEQQNAQNDFQKQDLPQLQRHYAALLGEAILPKETQKQYKDRESPPQPLGFIRLQDPLDILALEYLQEPTPLIDIISISSATTADKELELGMEYAIFARDVLFDNHRDDEMPLVKNGGRSAQKRLYHLLQQHPSNKGIVLREPNTPTSVHLRGVIEEEQASHCFDLAELVRDCNYPLEHMPRAETPALLAKHGLQLRNYQQASLQWMLHKEQSGDLGVAGELWAQLQDFSQSLYYYCPLTGSFSRNIFHSSSGLSKDVVKLPCGGILGEEYVVVIFQENNRMMSILIYWITNHNSHPLFCFAMLTEWDLERLSFVWP